MCQQRLPLLVAQQLAALQHILPIPLCVVLAAIDDGDLRQAAQADKCIRQPCRPAVTPGC